MKRQMLYVSNDLYQLANHNKKHYERLKNAKSHIIKPREYSLPSNKIGPMKIYEHNNTNKKLFHKLIQIYDQKPKYFTEVIKKHKNIKNQKIVSQKILSKTLVSGFKMHEQQQQINKRNLSLYKRIRSVKPTVGGWKERQNQLSVYSKLSRRKNPQQVHQMTKLENQEFIDFKKYLTKKKKKRHHSRISSTLDRANINPQTPIKNQQSNKYQTYTSELAHN